MTSQGSTEPRPSKPCLCWSCRTSKEWRTWQCWGFGPPPLSPLPLPPQQRQQLQLRPRGLRSRCDTTLRISWHDVFMNGESLDRPPPSLQTPQKHGKEPPPWGPFAGPHGWLKHESSKRKPCWVTRYCTPKKPSFSINTKGAKLLYL